MPDRPFYPGAALGFRYWVLTREFRLSSIARPGNFWERGRNRAVCASHSAVPAGGCHCGMYAYHELSSAVRKTQHDNVAFGLDDCASLIVIGAVAGYGNVEVHWSGWRAEEAEILGLWLSPAQALQAGRALGRRYEAPILGTGSELEQLAGSVDQPVPAQLRPPVPLDEHACRELARRYEYALGRRELDELAADLGMSSETLHHIAPHVCDLEGVDGHSLWC